MQFTIVNMQSQCSLILDLVEPTTVTTQPSNVQPSPARQLHYDDEPVVILQSLPDTQPADEPPLCCCPNNERVPTACYLL